MAHGSRLTCHADIQTIWFLIKDPSLHMCFERSSAASLELNFSLEIHQGKVQWPNRILCVKGSCLMVRMFTRKPLGSGSSTVLASVMVHCIPSVICYRHIVGEEDGCSWDGRVMDQRRDPGSQLISWIGLSLPLSNCRIPSSLQGCLHLLGPAHHSEGADLKGKVSVD